MAALDFRSFLSKRGVKFDPPTITAGGLSILSIGRGIRSEICEAPKRVQYRIPILGFP